MSQMLRWQLAVDVKMNPKPYRYHVDEGGFPGILQPYEGQLHLLFPEERLEPVQQFVD